MESEIFAKLKQPIFLFAFIDDKSPDFKFLKYTLCDPLFITLVFASESC